MTATRPPFTRSDMLATAGMFMVGVLFSFGLVGGVMFLFAGLWILWPVILFLLLFQLLFEGSARLIWWGVTRGWRALRGLPPPPPYVAPPRPAQPWLKSYAVLIGLFCGSLWLILSAWSNGDLRMLGGLL